MYINVKTIPHKEQKYDTCGNWHFEPDELQISVSEMKNDDYAFLIGIHEAIEAWLCHRRQISEDSVTEFDKAFRSEGEPGDDPAAPYRQEHFFAMSVERLIAQQLGVDWEEYNRAILSL